jgi:hypothetical protein
MQELDRSLALLCKADAGIMRQWREGTWQAQGFISYSILASRKPLQQLGARLVEAMQHELQAFQALPAPPSAQATPSIFDDAALRWGTDWGC